MAEPDRIRDELSATRRALCSLQEHCTRLDEVKINTDNVQLFEELHNTLVKYEEQLRALRQQLQMRIMVYRLQT